VADRTDAVREHAQPLAEAAGLDLVAVEVKGAGPQTLVRVRVDRKGGVDVAACQKLSKDLSAALDESDPIDNRYQLEVTSPGVDHPLQTRRDFDRVEGRLVAVRHKTGDEDVAEVKGKVLEATADAVVVEAAGDRVAVPYAEIVSASQTLPW
jgi:ribosome maturation factor RimP